MHYPRAMLFLIQCLSLFFIILSGCSKNDRFSHSQQKLKLNLYCEPPTLDSRKAADATSMNVLLMLFEGLTRMDQSGKPVCAVAKEIEISSDKKTYTFFLKDCLWSNGDPVTSHDFIYSWKTILDPKYPADFANKLYIIKNAQAIKENQLSMETLGVSALDDYTLQVVLEHPCPYFLHLTAFPTFYPIHRTIDQKNPLWASDVSADFVSNGPFQLTDWEHENEIVVTKNPLYWDSQSVKLEEINLIMINDTSTELNMFETGELDWAGSPLSNLPSEVIPSLKTNGKLHSFPAFATYYYKFNTEKIPFNNAKVRKAFSYAIDRQQIIDHILQAGQKKAIGIIPNFESLGYESSCFFKDADKERAQKLFQEGLAELKLTNEELPRITLSFNTNREHEKIALAIQQNWKETFNIQVELENVEWKVYLSKLSHKDFQIGRMGWIGEFLDPITFLEPFRFKDDPVLGGLNSTGWENKEFTQLLGQADCATDEKQRLKLLQKAEEILIEEMPIIPLFFIHCSYVKKDYVKNIYLSPVGFMDFKWAYVDPQNISQLPDRLKKVTTNGRAPI